jgi:hypothetical protein
MFTSPQIIMLMEFVYSLLSRDSSRCMKVSKLPVGGLYIHRIQNTLLESLNFRAQASRSCSLQYSVKSIVCTVHDKVSCTNIPTLPSLQVFLQ